MGMFLQRLQSKSPSQRSSSSWLARSFFPVAHLCIMQFVLTFDKNDYHSIRADKLDQVKADAASEIMVGLKEASNDVRKAADQLVKAAKKPPL